MHLDSRGYAYETYREGGRVCRRYVGSGEWVASAVLLSTIGREREQTRQHDERAQIKRLASDTEALQAFCVTSDALFRQTMKACGYHQHKRGAWRKRRLSLMAKSTQATEVSSLATSNKEHFELLKKANNGDKGAAAEALAIVKGLPEEAQLLDVVAPLFEMASSAVVNSFTDNELRRAGYRRRLELMRDELAGPMASPLELHLAERVALCALEVARLESLYHGNISSSPKVWEACGRQLHAAHRRHLSAIKTLAEVRKLKFPNVQVNVGQNQVNIV